MVSRSLRLLRSLLEDERGQDLIEYALLSATIGLAGYAVFSSIGGDMASAYTSWNGAVRSDALVEMPDPK